VVFTAASDGSVSLWDNVSGTCMHTARLPVLPAGTCAAVMQGERGCDDAQA
jgi:hypothetical protein